MGNVIGSDTLRAKGMEKEREARDLNTQSNELAQAESLEREAQMHRDRALGSGGYFFNLPFNMNIYGAVASGGGNFVNSNPDRRFNY